MVITVSYNITDVHGASVPQTATITVHGTNDSPYVQTAIADQHVNEDTAWSFTVPAGAFADPDTNDTLTYSATLANGDPLPLWLSFNPVTHSFSGTPPQDFNGTISLKVTVTDDGNLSASDTFDLIVDPVNDAPVNTLPVAFSTNEDTPVKLAGLSVSDVDAASAAISVTLSVGGGTLSAASGGGVTVSGSGSGSITLSGSQADINAYLANVSSQPTFTPVANANGPVSLTMTTSDNGNTGSGGALGDTDVSAINITPVNDAPAGTDGSVTTAEDTAKVLTAGDFGFTDPNDSPANAFASVKITTLPGAGTLTLNSVAVTAGQLVSVADVNAGLLVYTPATDASGSTSLTFQVQDDGGTANGGINLDASPNTLTINVTPVNDAPDIRVESGDAASAILTETNSGLSASHTLTVTDVDTSDTISTSLSLTGISGDQGTLTNAQLLAMFSAEPTSGIAANVGDANNLTWTFNSGTEAFHYLAPGQSLQLTYTLTVSDGHGGTDTQAVTVTINGTADGVTLPATFTGTGDPNDFDSLGNPAGQNLSGTATNGNDTIYGGAGADTINGGAGDDIIYGGSGGDTLGGGNDGDRLYGGSGSDTISGGNSNDVIIGGYGADTLTGSAGNDTFVYLDARDTNDTITDFTSGADKIDLSAIDADPLFAGDQGFTFGGTTATAHGIWYAQSGGNVIVYVDTDGNVSTAELAITLTGVSSVGSGDFLLGP
jgi:VCBS repeat-containing protein